MLQEGISRKDDNAPFYGIYLNLLINKLCQEKSSGFSEMAEGFWCLEITEAFTNIFQNWCFLGKNDMTSPLARYFKTKFVTKNLNTLFSRNFLKP